MKKIICLTIMFVMFIMSGTAVYSEDNSESDILQDSGATSITLPENTNDFINENNISISEPQGIVSLSPQKVIAYVWESFQDKITVPLKLLGGILAVILLSSLMSGMANSVTNENIVKVFDIITVLICVSIIANPVCDVISLASSTLVDGGNFMISYVPIFSGILASSGNITSAGSYNVIVLFVAQIFVQLANTYLLPVLGFCMALSVVESINPTISLSGITNGLKKISIWGIGFMMTIFVGMLTIQSIVGTSADTLAIKAGKFMVSSFIPVVGGAISDAYTTIKGSLGLLRGGVGSFGIIALVLTVLPTILSIFSVQISVGLGQVAADIFGVKQISAFLKNISSVLSIAMSLVLCFSVMLIISTTIVMMVGMNIG
ncbi:MAG TPA: hypothetical protein PKI60_05680 [Oscillospiraceae bacterium]|nr:hypothetical protein [Oscillospiraceae bacterium]